jgi:hypothetical protein
MRMFWPTGSSSAANSTSRTRSPITATLRRSLMSQSSMKRPRVMISVSRLRYSGMSPKTPKLSLLSLRVTRFEPPKRPPLWLRGTTLSMPSRRAARYSASSSVITTSRPGCWPAKGLEVRWPQMKMALGAQLAKSLVTAPSSPRAKPSITTSIRTPQNTPQAVRMVRSLLRRRL